MSKKPLLPPEARTAFDRAFELRERGQSAEAISAFKDLLSAYPWVAKAWLVLGDLHWDGHDYESAAECFRTAVQLRPQDEDASLGLFHTLLNGGHIEQCIAEARRFSGELQRGATCTTETATMYADWLGDGERLGAAWRRSRS
jgi:tetratricopeptide (TPR) repeat protein